ncbi:PREDICTED: uncharacterized protein LOC105522558 [Colobus angolensis palliatus]|uniref:uncharacterized protein LOC105522558 n=1 Tax=Colobus angolensis palliatus TaxID=336983 RepID=UPI0005F57D75|nr:PREDICTED: uncharacterized protein LOC105522558 [Colobus angolensis palliatus]
MSETEAPEGSARSAPALHIPLPPRPTPRQERLEPGRRFPGRVLKTRLQEGVAADLGSARAPAPALQIRKGTSSGLLGRGGRSGPGNNLSSVTGNWRGSSFAVERYVRRAAATPTLSGPAEPRMAGPGLGVALAAEALRVGGNRRLLPPPPPRPPLEAPESLRGCPESPATVEGPTRRADVVGLAGGEDTAAPSRVTRSATLRTLLNAGGVCARSPICKDHGRPRACVSQRSELASLNGEADRSVAPASLEARISLQGCR